MPAVERRFLMLNRNYRDVRFKDEAEFEKYHREQAEKGNEISKGVLNTLSRVRLALLFEAKRKQND